MAATLLLDPATWDLVIDANGNIAVATEPYALAQDAASEMQEWLGEGYWDTTAGVDYPTYFGQPNQLNQLRSALQKQAKLVPGVASADVFFTALTARELKGQVQTTQTTGQQSAANFSVANVQGGG